MLLSRIRREHSNEQRWNYGVTLDANNTNSFAALLNLSNPDYIALLLSLGLIKMNKSGKIQVGRNRWNDFVAEHKLDNVYFDQMKVKNVPTGNTDITEDYYGYWIGVGISDKAGDRVMNPRSQFQTHNNLQIIQKKKGATSYT